MQVGDQHLPGNAGPLADFLPDRLGRPQRRALVGARTVSASSGPSIAVGAVEAGKSAASPGPTISPTAASIRGRSAGETFR